jgi:hypothetical protein
VLKVTARLLSLASLSVVLFLGVSHFLAFGADGKIHRLVRQILLEMRRADALHQRQAEQAEVMEIKHVATKEFIAGRMTLREAAKQFRAANALVQADSDGLVATFMTPETEQGLCQQVAIWTRIALGQGYTSEEAEEVCCRLEEEMNESFPSTEDRLHEPPSLLPEALWTATTRPTARSP